MRRRLAHNAPARCGARCCGARVPLRAVRRRRAVAATARRRRAIARAAVAATAIHGRCRAASASRVRADTPADRPGHAAGAPLGGRRGRLAKGAAQRGGRRRPGPERDATRGRPPSRGRARARGPGAAGVATAGAARRASAAGRGRLRAAAGRAGARPTGALALGGAAQRGRALLAGGGQVVARIAIAATVRLCGGVTIVAPGVALRRDQTAPEPRQGPGAPPSCSRTGARLRRP